VRRPVLSSKPLPPEAEPFKFAPEPASQPKEKEIHIIADNLSAHKTKKVSAFLQANPNVRFHYTPTYSSWLNQVEIWFSKIQRQTIARGVFRSADDLARKIMRFTRNYNKTATPIRRRYADEKQRISFAI
jgi:transposase